MQQAFEATEASALAFLSIKTTQSQSRYKARRVDSPLATWRKSKMKNCTLFVVLLLAATLAMPAFAQDNSTSQTQSTTTQSSSQTQMKGDTATGKQPLQPEAREGFWGRVNPFARK